jgi:hypothetical protein
MQRPLFLAMAGCFDALGVFRTPPSAESVHG